MNYSSYENVTSLVDMMTVTNNVSGGYLINGFVLVTWIVLFFSSVGYGRSKALIYSSFINFILCLVLNVAGWLSFWVVALNILGVAVGVGYMLFNKRE